MTVKETIRVKLTDNILAAHRARYDALYGNYREYALPYSPPMSDADGYAELPLSVLLGIGQAGSTINSAEL